MPRQVLITASLVTAVVLGLIVVAPHRPRATPIRTTIQSALKAGASNRRSLALVGDVQRASRHYDGYAQWRFVLEDAGDAVPVRYRGIVPSTFEEGARVLVTGGMQGDTFVATSLAVRM